MSDLNTLGAYDDVAWDMYLGNDRLAEQAASRYEDVSGWKYGAPVEHVPTIALDYLFEAMMAYAFGFYRSAIFCCATLLDLELKRRLISAQPAEESRIRHETFGQSIQRFGASRAHGEEIEGRLEGINRVRNRVSVHVSATS